MTRFGPPLVTTHSVIQTPIHTQYGQPVALPLRYQRSIEDPEDPEDQELEGYEEENNQKNEFVQLKHPTHASVSVPLGRSLQQQFHASRTPSTPRTALPAAMTPQMRVNSQETVVYSKDVVQFRVNRLSDHHDQPWTVVMSKREHELMLKHLPHLLQLSAEKLLYELIRINETMKQMTSPDDIQATEKTKELVAKVQALEDELAQTKAILESVRQREAQLKQTLEQYKSSGGNIEVVTSLREENQSLKQRIRAQSIETQEIEAKATVLQDEVDGLLENMEQLKEDTLFEIQQVHEFTKDMMNQVVLKAQEEKKHIEACYLEEKQERQLIAEKYHEVSGRIRVFCRLRPGQTNALVLPKRNTVLVPKQQKEFQFDQVFAQDSTQAQVYEQIEPVIVSFMDGFNACLLAYGQTGAGKTHTMVGLARNPELEGMIPRALQQVFHMRQARTVSFQDTLSISMIEIYNDQIVDLLVSNNSQALKNENQISTRVVNDFLQVDKILEEGNRNRSKASTNMNMDSSRSHALVFLHLSSLNLHTMDTRKSSLCLVDLAGSERVSRSQVSGDRLKETQHINKSLSALGDVIYALQHKSKHIPFRNSKLTYILREMLSGKAKTLMMLQLSPEEQNIEETICSLQFGARVSQVQLGAVQRSEESGEILRLRREKEQLEAKMYRLQAENQELIDRQLELQAHHELLQLQQSQVTVRQAMTASVATEITSEVASAPVVIEADDEEEDDIVLGEMPLIMMERASIEVEEAFDEVFLVAPTDFSSTIRPKTPQPSASPLHCRRSSTTSSTSSSASSSPNSRRLSSGIARTSSFSRSSTTSSTVASRVGTSATTTTSGSASRRTASSSSTPSRRSSLYESKRVHGTGSVATSSTASTSSNSRIKKPTSGVSATCISRQGSTSSTYGTSRILRPSITRRISLSSTEDNTVRKTSTSTVRTKSSTTNSTSTSTGSNNSRSKALWR